MFTFVFLLGSIGGSIGLGIGLSLVTIVEFGFYIFDYIRLMFPPKNIERETVL